MDYLTDKELDDIETRCNAASDGPWISYIEGRDHLSGSNFIKRGSGTTRSDDLELTGATVADQDFIAHARQDIPKLIAELRHFRTLAQLRSGIK
jgi:hypothetical protein